MSAVNVFKRYELKFMLTADDKRALADILEGRAEIDPYGRTTIRNVYYDTPEHMLIKRSLSKPVYKEKLRVRSYCRVTEDDNVFVEIKKKYEGVVYKRRIALPEHQVQDWLAGKSCQPVISQIADEIEYMRNFYGSLTPACFLSYDRESFRFTDGTDLRLTLDENIKGRNYDMTLKDGIYGTSIIPDGSILMELKTSAPLPLYLTGFLSQNRIRPVSFSKYGTYYKNCLTRNCVVSKLEGGLLYA